MSDQNQIFRAGQSVDAAASSGINADGANLQAAQSAVDDVLSDFFGGADNVPVESVGGATEQRPEIRNISSEEFVRRFRQETGE
ncbi:MAG: hypothetical protein OHK0023_02490 [Anaerolineae bacterium]